MVDPGYRGHRHSVRRFKGQARFTAGDETLTVSGGHIVVVPSGTPHKFVNDGTGALRMINIHAAGKIETQWLEA